MKAIVPAILEKDFKEIKNKLAFLRGRAQTVQIDFCDGVFVPNQTWPFASGGLEDTDFKKIVNEEEGMPYWQDFDFEFDMMVMDAVENFDIYMKLGPKRIIFHLMAQKNLQEFEEFLEGVDPYVRDNTEIGLAFRPSEDIDTIVRLSHKVDFLHCMGSDKIGYQGEPFREEALERIRFLKEKLPGIEISVDIGINLGNAETILAAGADRLGIGSGIWKAPDPVGALEKFQSLLQDGVPYNNGTRT
jgi:pentose-5-phosphate-3-epimerase